MALLFGNGQKDEVMTQTGASSQAGEAPAGTPDLSYLEEFAGFGVDKLKEDTTLLGGIYLSVTNPLSKTVTERQFPLGQWAVSSEDKALGETVDVYILDQQTVYIEQDPKDATITFNKWNSIMPDWRREKSDKNYVRYFAAGTDHPIREYKQFVFLLADKPELGPVYFQPGSGVWGAVRNLLNQVKLMTLPNGEPAPVFSTKWTLIAGKMTNKERKDYYGLVASKPNGFMPPELVKGIVRPLLATLPDLLKRGLVQALPEPDGAEVSSNVTLGNAANLR